ncbi:TetR/AcrR family transcriptional regulator [bacterium]|nr:TetR/AcrR family transcriptional regulator [bacterium]
MAEVISLKTRTRVHNDIASDVVARTVVDLVTEGGYSTVTLEEIARRANVPLASLGRFNNKHALVEAVVSRCYFDYVKLIDFDEMFQESSRERAQLFIALAWQHYHSDIYLAYIEILLATRSDRNPMSLASQVGEIWEYYLAHCRKLFPESNLNDREFQEAFTMLHCSLSGLAVQKVMIPDLPNLGGYLKKITDSFLLILKI